MLILLILQRYHSKGLSADPFLMAFFDNVQILREFSGLTAFTCGDQPSLSCKCIIPGTLFLLLCKSIIIKELEMSIVRGSGRSAKGAGRSVRLVAEAWFFWMIDRAHC